ncbi:MAG: PilZ domain-containing protein [Planctomycetota bacterium]
MSQDNTFNRRVAERVAVPPMYSEIRLHQDGDDHEKLEGHIYDVSSSGIRLELDEPVDPGANVCVEIDLPGLEASVDARGTVVWVNDDLDDPGPRRMAVQFDAFQSDDDRARLVRFLGQSRTRRAA